MENPNCVAIDHNYKDSTCWIGEKTSDLVTQHRWTDDNQYILKNKCDTLVANRERYFVFNDLCCDRFHLLYGAVPAS